MDASARRMMWDAISTALYGWRTASSPMHSRSIAHPQSQHPTTFQPTSLPIPSTSSDAYTPSFLHRPSLGNCQDVHGATYGLATARAHVNVPASPHSTDVQGHSTHSMSHSAVNSLPPAVVLTTHFPEEAAVLCDRAAYLQGGRMVWQGAPRDADGLEALGV